MRYAGHDRAREVWFEKADSASVKPAAARHHDIGGILLWMFGDEDSPTWATPRGLGSRTR